MFHDNAHGNMHEQQQACCILYLNFKFRNFTQETTYNVQVYFSSF